MTHTPPRGHQAVIASALTDWWLTNDAAHRPNLTDAARLVEEDLLHAGFYIAPYNWKTAMPKRRTIAATLLIALICGTGTGFAAADGRWTWTAFGVGITLAFVIDAARDLDARRNARTRR
ncbi:hypothetical protein AB0H77_03635 [Streptomyces sp. NPDC050844]|uniref:hypothetical protein n=1 Tax=Streptomyces sp. NPDC050844 TaxID=3155790 RepID=UPI0033FB2A7B